MLLPNRRIKKILFAGVLATLVGGLFFVWKHRAPVPAGGSPEKIATAPAPGTPPNLSAAVPSAVPPALSGRTAAGSRLNPERRAWDYGYLASLNRATSGSPIRFELTGGAYAAGSIRHLEHTNGELISLSGELTLPEPGRFFFQKQTLPGKQGDFAGLIEFPASKSAWRIEPTGPDGRSELVKRPLAEVMCLALPAMSAADLAAWETEPAPPLRPDLVPDYVPAYNDGIISLQSLPGATGVLYIDYRGGYTPTWGGITYDKPGASNAQIKDVWKRVAEDYLPFNINVTTDIRVYQAAPENSRQRCVCTPTTTAAPGAGGVSYIGSWNWTGDTPNWSFYSTGKAAAEVIAHECGHAVGLSHETTDINGVHTEYFTGQGTGATGWCPIMGAGYYQNVTTWSQGEFQYAGNLEDQLNIITNANNHVAYRADDTGSTLATARYLEVFSNYAASAEGVIETTGDTDAFRFTTTGGALSLTASPVGDWADLALMATLADDTETIIASNNLQTVLSASIVTNLPAGTYTFRVTGTGRNSPLTNGFSAYASLGYYSITGSVANATLPARFSLAENATNGTPVGSLTVTNLGVDPLNLAIISGNTSNTFALDDNGTLTVANAVMLDYEALAKKTQLTVQFELFVNITNLANPALTEFNRRVVVQILDVNEAPSLTGFTNSLIAHTQVGTVAGTVTATDPDAYSLLTLSIVGGNSNAMFSLDNTTGNLVVAGDLNTAIQKVYNLSLQVADNGSPPLKATNYAQITVISNTSPFSPGSISYALYDNIGTGVYVSNLTSNAHFPTDPTAERQILTAEGDSNRADGYGSVLRGYFIPPVSGNYNFYLATDDNGELWMSTTTNPANMTLIANLTGASSYASPRQWNKYSTQKSSTRSLVAGQAYYLEARQKEGSGGDNLAVGWSSTVTGNQTNVIPATYLAPYFLNYVPHATGFTNKLHRDTFAGARVGQVRVIDVNTNDGHTFAILSGNSAGIFGVDSNGWILVTNDVALAASVATNFTLSLRITDTGKPALSTTNLAVLNLVEAGVVSVAQVQREIFNAIGSGTLVSDLTGNARFPGRPDALVPLTNFMTSVDVADAYGSRIRAYLVPPVSGDYQFFIASDDNSLLKFSRDTNAANATSIASVASGAGWTATNEWNKLSGQTSSLITNLIAGQRYYLEALQKEGGGGDHVEVGWLVPGSGVTNIIPAANLQPVDLNYPPQFGSQSFSLMTNAANGAWVCSLLATDSPLDTLTYRILAGNTNSTFALDPNTGALTVANNALLAGAVGLSFLLQVAVQDSGYGGLYPLRSATNNVTISLVGTNGLMWDPGTGVAGLQDGSGNWGAAPANWWTGSTNVTWTNSSIAFFGAGTATNCTVTITNDVTPAGLVFVPNNGGVYTLAGAGGGLNLAGAPVITANANATLSATLKGAAFVKNGNGILLLSGTNTSTGGVTVSAGTLKLTNTVASLGFGPVTNNATIEWNTAAATRIISTINALAGSGLFLKSGVNNLQIQGAAVSTFNGTVRVAGGLLILDTASGFENGTPNLDVAGGDLVLGNAFDNATATFGNLSGSNQVRVDWGNTLVTRTLSLNQSSNTVFAGVLGYRAGLSRTLNLVKNGAGTLTLSGTNVHLGSTIISNGTLLVNGVLTTNTTSLVTVATNGVLGGTGLINNPVLVQDGGTLAPGSGGLGKLTASNNVSLAGNSRTMMKLGKNGGSLTNDLLVVSGIFTQGGLLVITNVGTNALQAGDRFQLFQAGTNSGTFSSFDLPLLAPGLEWNTSGLAASNVLWVAWQTFTLAYAADGNGTISGASPQTVNFSASGDAVTAVPNPGWYFVNWSDGLMANPRTDLNVTNDLSVIAHFASLAPPVITGFNSGPDHASFSLGGTGSPNQLYVLLSATNLPPVNWLPLATNAADINGVFQFTGLQITNVDQCFYRIMSY